MLKLNLPAVTLALALAGCASPQGGGSCRIARAAVLPFSVRNGHLLVGVTINNAPATLIFDTGAFTTMLTTTAVRRLRLGTEQERFGRMEGIGGAQNLSLVVAKTIDIGGLHASNFHFAASEFGLPAGAMSDGLLSTDLLSKYELDLDFPGRRIILYYPLADCSHPSAALEQPLYAIPILPMREGRTPRIEVAIGGKSFVAALDTGAPKTLMFRGAAARLGLRIGDLAADPHATARGVGPEGITSIRHVFEPIQVGDLTVEHMPVEIVDQSAPGDIDMLLGLDFQVRVHLWISYASNTLILQYPPRPSPPFTAH